MLIINPKKGLRGRVKTNITQFSLYSCFQNVLRLKMPQIQRRITKKQPKRFTSSPSFAGFRWKASGTGEIKGQKSESVQGREGWGNLLQKFKGDDIGPCLLAVLYTFTFIISIAVRASLHAVRWRHWRARARRHVTRDWQLSWSIAHSLQRSLCVVVWRNNQLTSFVAYHRSHAGARVN